MSATHSVADSNGPSTGAGFAGAGGGTLLTVISVSLPEGNPIKPWLVYLAPSVAVGLSAVWLWAQRLIANHFREKEVRQLFNNAKSTLQTALKNPNTTEEHRKRLQSQLEELEVLDVGRIVDRIKMLKVLDSSEIPSSERRREDNGGVTGIAG